MKNSFCSLDPVHAPAAADPVCHAPTRLDMIRKSWLTDNPPKDGTFIIAVGHVIYQTSSFDDGFVDQDDASALVTCSEPFVAAVQWTGEGKGAGWHYASADGICPGLAVARTLEDKVIIDFWLGDPAECRTDVRCPELPAPVLEHGTWNGRPS